MSPPAPGTLWRETESDGTVVDGVILPKGVEVGTCIYAYHHDDTFFRNQAEFWPERWLPGSLPEPESIAAKAALRPFSMGPRACAGRQFTLMEQSVAIARLVYTCDFRTPPGKLGNVGQGHPQGRCGRKDVNEFQIETHFSASSHGPFLQFKRRSNVQ